MRHLSQFVLSAIVVPTLLCGALDAQRLAAYFPGPAILDEIQPPLPILPAAVPPLAVYPQLPAMPALGAPAGDSTFDNRAGYHWVTNGALMCAQPTPTFPPVGLVPAPFPIPAAVLAAIGGGPVTGIAMDTINNRMWVVGAAGITVGCTPVAGMPIVFAAFPMMFAHGAITGLDYDFVTGALIACDAAGFTYHYFTSGLLFVGPLPPPPGIAGMATDVAIDRTIRSNSAGLRPTYLLAGGMIADINAPPFWFPSSSLAAAAVPEGLAFLNTPAANPPAGTCFCPGTNYPTRFTNGPMTSGNAGWGIGVGGLPAGFPVLFAFDFAFLPGFPLVNTVGCGLGLTAIPIVFGGIADPAGNAVLPLPLVPPTLPLGSGPFYNQNVTLCAADPALGLVLTPTQTVYVAEW